MSLRKRVLYLHHISTIGGASYCLLNLLANTDTSLFEPIVGLKSDGPLVSEIDKLGIKVVFFPEMTPIPYNHSLLHFRSIRSYYRSLKSCSKFVKILKENKVDIVYLNNMMLVPYIVPAKRFGCKTVMHVREHWPLDEHKLQLRLIRKWVSDYCDKLIAINKYSASIFPDKASVIVYDWVDMKDRYRYFPLDDVFGENCSNKKILLFTGGILPIKGIDYILDSFINHLKGEDYRLLILGSISDNLFVGWKHKIKSIMELFGYNYYEKNIMARIKTDARIRCIPAVYELCHIVEQSYCFVSYFRMPHANLALAESIIMKKPCIAAETEESLEYSNSGEYAMLVPINNEKLMEFLSNIDYWKNKAIEGSGPIADLFSKENNVLRYRTVMCELL